MRIRLKQTVRFIDRKSLAIVQPELIVHASNETQNVPEWLQNTLEFELLQESGHLEVIASPQPRNRIPSAASVGGADIGDTGIPQGSDADPTKEGNEENLKLSETIDHAAENARLRAQIADLQAQAERDLGKKSDAANQAGSLEDAQRKSSGQDGDAGDWITAGRRVDGSPCEKGSPEDTTATPAEKGAYTRRLNAANQAGSRG